METAHILPNYGLETLTGESVFHHSFTDILFELIIVAKSAYFAGPSAYFDFYSKSQN